MFNFLGVKTHRALTHYTDFISHGGHPSPHCAYLWIQFMRAPRGHQAAVTHEMKWTEQHPRNIYPRRTLENEMRVWNMMSAGPVVAAQSLRNITSYKVDKREGTQNTLHDGDATMRGHAISTKIERFRWLNKNKLLVQFSLEKKKARVHISFLL